MAAPNLDNYVEVSERITEFHAKYPEGTIQSNYDYIFDADHKPILVVVQAFAHRTPDDERPGVGSAAEIIPGKTPYTKDSELQNAETAAWGRAVIAVGAATAKRGVASREEVRNRQKVDNTAGLKAVGDLCAARGWNDKEQKRAVAEAFTAQFRAQVVDGTNDDLVAFVALVTEGQINPLPGIGVASDE